MKTKTFLCVLFISLASAVRADVESDRAALRVIKAAYEEACRSGDPQKLAPYLSPNVTGVMVTGEEVVGLEGLKNYWARIQALMGPGGTYATSINVEATEVFGDTSVSRGTTDDVVRLASGRELKFNSRWTAVCRRENGSWIIHRMQASLNPIQNIFVTTRIVGVKVTYGIGGAVAGLILGFLLFRRKRAGQMQPAITTR